MAMRKCLVIFNFSSLDVETKVINAAGRLSEIVYASWLLQRNVYAKQKIVNGARDERFKPIGLQLAAAALAIDIAIAIVQSLIYLIVMVRKDNTLKFTTRF